MTHKYDFTFSSVFLIADNFLTCFKRENDSIITCPWYSLILAYSVVGKVFSLAVDFVRWYSLVIAFTVYVGVGKQGQSCFFGYKEVNSFCPLDSHGFSQSTNKWK